MWMRIGLQGGGWGYLHREDRKVMGVGEGGRQV